MEKNERTIKSEMIYEGRILNLRLDTVELPNQKYSKREIVEHSKAVCIIPVKDGKVFFVKQFRKAIEKVIFELPAGLVEVNEEPRAAAIREMREEIGYNAHQVEYLFDGYSSPGFTDEKTLYFLAQDLYHDPLVTDEDEFLEVTEVAMEEALRMVLDGEIEDAKTIIGILYLAREFQLK